MLSQRRSDFLRWEPILAHTEFTRKYLNSEHLSQITFSSPNLVLQALGTFRLWFFQKTEKRIYHACVLVPVRRRQEMYVLKNTEYWWLQVASFIWLGKHIKWMSGARPRQRGREKQRHAEAKNTAKYFALKLVGSYGQSLYFHCFVFSSLFHKHRVSVQFWLLLAVQKYYGI